jgi:hypothetical protein
MYMSDEIPVAEIEKILLEDPHILEIRRDVEIKLPEFDYGLFEGDDDLLRRSVSVLEQAINSPYIIDDFGPGEHGPRRRWRSALMDKYSWFQGYYQWNAFKHGFRQAFLSTCEVMEKNYLGSERDELYGLCLKVKEQSRIPDKKFEELTDVGRIDYIHRMKNSMMDVFYFLSSVCSALS